MRESAPWVRPAGHCLVNGKPAYVTDAPWFHRLPGGDLLMLWSSFGEGGYATGTVRSRSGKLAGPWDHDPLPLFDRDGGHSMIFRALDGQLTLALHQPNRPPHERAQFFPLAVTRSGGRETLAIA